MLWHKKKGAAQFVLELRVPFLAETEYLAAEIWLEEACLD